MRDVCIGESTPIFREYDFERLGEVIQLGEARYVLLLRNTKPAMVSISTDPSLY
jgi:hypothetical protein